MKVPTKILQIVAIVAVFLAIVWFGTSRFQQEPTLGKGSQFPELSWTDATGTNYSTVGLRGQAFAIKIGSATCTSCRQDDETLEGFVDSLPGSLRSKFTFFYFQGTDADAAEGATKLGYRLVRDFAPSLRDLGLAQWPAHIIVDANGTIQFYSTGANPQARERLSEVLAETAGL